MTKFKQILYSALTILIFLKCSTHKENKCKIEAKVNKTRLCIPEFNGYKSCYNDSIKLSFFKKRFRDIKLINVHLLNDEYVSFDSLKSKGFTNYISVSYPNDFDSLISSQKTIDSLSKSIKKFILISITTKT